MKLIKKLFTLGLVVLGLHAAAAFASDLTTTAATAQGALATALPFLQQLASMPLNLVGIALLLSSLGGFAMEHGLEQFVMDHVGSDTIKKLLPMAGGLLMAVLANVAGGMPWSLALTSGFTTYVAAVAKHDSPLASQSAAAAVAAAPPAKV